MHQTGCIRAATHKGREGRCIRRDASGPSIVGESDALAVLTTVGEERALQLQGKCITGALQLQ